MKAIWQPVLDNAPWPSRDSPGAVVHRDHMWILGGFEMLGANQFGRLNDVWRSPDGIAWEQIGKAPWAARNLPGCVVYKDAIWMLGGFDGESSLSDIWRTDDGYRWDRVVERAPWGGRGAFGCAVHRDMIWVFGGVNWENELALGDIWCSDNGEHWDLVTEDPGWTERGMFPSLIWQDRIWMFGGGVYHDRGVNYSDVWSSCDGEHWDQITSDAGWAARRFHGAILLDSALWLMGGCTDGSINKNDVWGSANGETWHPSDSPPWGVRHEFGLLGFGDKIWLLGGFSGSLAGLIVYNDVWTMQSD